MIAGYIGFGFLFFFCVLGLKFSFVFSLVSFFIIVVFFDVCLLIIVLKLRSYFNFFVNFLKS